MMELIGNPNSWIALLTLTFLEIVLGIDNIIFISIVTGKLPEEKQKKSNPNWIVLGNVLAYCFVIWYHFTHCYERAFI